MLHKRWQVGLADAAASLLWLRLQDACVLGVLGVALLLPAPPSWRAALSLLLLAAGALLGPPLLRRLRAAHAGRTALQPPGTGRAQAFLAPCDHRRPCAHVAARPAGSAARRTGCSSSSSTAGC